MTVDIQHYGSLRCTAERLDVSLSCAVVPGQAQDPPGTTHSYYDIRGSVPWPVPLHPLTVLQLSVCAPESLPLSLPGPRPPPVGNTSISHCLARGGSPLEAPRPTTWTHKVCSPHWLPTVAPVAPQGLLTIV